MSKRKEDRDTALDEVQHLVQTLGIRAAAQALIDVCQDPKAAAPAKATAGTTIFRAAGFFDAEKKTSAKELHQMTWDELEANREQLERERAAMLREMRGEDDVFT